MSRNTDQKTGQIGEEPPISAENPNSQELISGLIERGIVDEQAARDEGFDAVDAALAAVDLALEEQDRMERSLRAQKGAATRARHEREALEVGLPDRPREFGEPFSNLPSEELLERIGEATAVELAFVGENGRELGEVRPRDITGCDWRMHAGRALPRLGSVELHGPGTGRPPYRLTGYALLLDGQPEALVARESVLVIGPGQTVQLKDDIAF